MDESNWAMRMPTCVAAFDSIVKGGLPAGSVVLLKGEPGAGHAEFAYTSAARLSLVKLKPEMKSTIIDPAYKDIHIPELEKHNGLFRVSVFQWHYGVAKDILPTRFEFIYREDSRGFVFSQFKIGADANNIESEILK